MRKIEKNIIHVLEELKDADYMTWDNFSLSVRDSIYKDRETIQYKLWNNIIFEYKRKENAYYFSFCGYSTNTTKSRLNAILHAFFGANIYQKDYKWFLDWNGKKYLVDSDSVFMFKGNKLYRLGAHEEGVKPL